MFCNVFYGRTQFRMYSALLNQPELSPGYNRTKLSSVWALSRGSVLEGRRAAKGARKWCYDLIWPGMLTYVI